MNGCVFSTFQSLKKQTLTTESSQANAPRPPRNGAAGFGGGFQIETSGNDGSGDWANGGCDDFGGTTPQVASGNWDSNGGGGGNIGAVASWDTGAGGGDW